MSKSLNNYIGINETPEDMYGKTMSIPDSLMMMYYELITELTKEEIATLREGLETGSLHPRDVKKRLAFEVTKRFCSEEGAKAGEAHFERVFSQKQLPEDIEDLVINPQLVTDGRIWIIKLITEAKFAASNGEARRLVQQGGVKIDGEAVLDPNLEWLVQEGAIVQVGKRKFGKVALG